MGANFTLRQDECALVSHSTRRACVIEAIERGLLLDAGYDGPGTGAGTVLADGVTITPEQEPAR